MGKKRGKTPTKGGDATAPTPRKHLRYQHINDDDMDDDVDTFHKQRDIVPLEIDEEISQSDDDDVLPVLDDDNINDDSEEDDDDDEALDTGFAAKIVKQQKYMNAKYGGVDDVMQDGEEEEEEEQQILRAGKKHEYYDADNRDFDGESGDDESAEEEEAEVLRLQREKAKSSTREDFGLEDISQTGSDEELTFEEISVKGKRPKKSLVGIEAIDEMGTAHEEVKKDLDALSKEEKMDVLYNSAPELVGLLSELNDAHEELESKVNPLLSKVKKGEVMLEGGIHYLEVKQLLLLAYCQAITFYLLLKSEGQPVRDHPVLARLIEIKSLLDKMKQLDENLPSDFEEILSKYNGVEAVVNSGKANANEGSGSFAQEYRPQSVLVEAEAAAVHDIAELENVKAMENNENKVEKRKRQNDEVGVQSMKMLKVRAALEEKLKQKGVFSSFTLKTDKPNKLLKPLNGKLESYDDFDDDAVNAEGAIHGVTNGRASKLSQLVAANPNKSKVVSGDDDLPRRDDIGERRRKHELRVLAGAGIKSEDDGGEENGIVSDDEDVEMEDSETGDSEDEFYEQVKEKQAAKLAAKAEKYSRSSTVPSMVETEAVDGKRHITYQMEKNRGLTRARKKLIKNPRKKYKLKHKKATERRKGQVRPVKKPVGPYGGETTGINSAISRSTRF